MRKLIIPLLAAIVLVLASFGALYAARGQAARGLDGGVVINSENQDGNVREITALDDAAAQANAANQPNIGFIDSPTAACVQPNRTKNECFVNWYYLSVDASPNYMITMTVKLNDFGYVASYNGFFQTSMYAPYSMTPQGYLVPCGPKKPNGWGNSYAYTIRARDSANLASANYGSVTCPAYIP